VIVVDASSTLAWLFAEQEPVDWLDRLLNGGIVVPALWRLEVVNVVLKKERQRLISEEQGLCFIRALDALDVESVEPPKARTLEELMLFSRPHQLSAYDAVYLELALNRQAALLSLDSNLLAAARRLGVTLAEEA
jgi:predicted nucleic acid-binding protein